MEFNEKLQELRKQKGLTQEEVANALFVSRTAISKWESGRGYPNIDSLKAIASFFSVTVDELLSGEQLLSLAEKDLKQKGNHLCDLLFGLLDCAVLSLLFIPLFAQKSAQAIQSCSLLSLDSISNYLKIAYFFIVILIALFGLLTLTLQNCNKKIWLKGKTKISLLLNLCGIILFISGLQPYAAVFLLIFFIIKISLLAKK